jgi:hypothetical protein
MSYLKGEQGRVVGTGTCSINYSKLLTLFSGKCGIDVVQFYLGRAQFLGIFPGKKNLNLYRYELRVSYHNLLFVLITLYNGILDLYVSYVYSNRD